MSDLVYENIIEVFDCTVAEMGSANGAAALVRLDPEVVAEISEGDDDPRFATFIIESGDSVNGRNWQPEVFQSVCEQVNNANDPVVGYLGHIPDDDLGSAFPPIQIQWLKARLNVASDKCQMYVKGYVLPSSVPGAVGREYIKRKLVKTVSWAGKAGMRARHKGGYDVVDFALKSIDFARPRSAGMRTALVGGLTTEMENNDGGTVEAKDIAALTEADLRANNPLLVKKIEDDAKAELQTTVKEMEGAAEEAQPAIEQDAKLREALGVEKDADVLELVKNLMLKAQEKGVEIRDGLLDKVLEGKFKDAGVRKLVKTALVSEMESADLDGDNDKVEARVSEMVNDFIDGDEDFRRLVSEMEGGGGRSLAGRQDDRNHEREIKEGYENDRIRVRKVGARR